MDTDQAHSLCRSLLVAHSRCMEQHPLPNGEIELPMVPAIVCAALSVEIGFKALILSDGRKEGGHKLAELFEKLPASSQQLIVREVGVDQTTFQQELNAVSNAFVDWRYIYEKPSKDINLEFLFKLAAATQKTSAGRNDDNGLNRTASVR